MSKSGDGVMNLTCEQCDEMFQECTNEVPPDAPAGYLQCQLLWEACKKKCKGTSALTAEEVDRIVRSKVELQ